MHTQSAPHLVTGGQFFMKEIKVYIVDGKKRTLNRPAPTKSLIRLIRVCQSCIGIKVGGEMLDCGLFSMMNIMLNVK